jgi:hypothetical protein
MRRRRLVRLHLKLRRDFTSDPKEIRAGYLESYSSPSLRRFRRAPSRPRPVLRLRRGEGRGSVDKGNDGRGAALAKIPGGKAMLYFGWGSRWTIRRARARADGPSSRFSTRVNVFTLDISSPLPHAGGAVDGRRGADGRPVPGTSSPPARSPAWSKARQALRPRLRQARGRAGSIRSRSARGPQGNRRRGRTIRIEDEKALAGRLALLLVPALSALCAARADADPEGSEAGSAKGIKRMTLVEVTGPGSGSGGEGAGRSVGSSGSLGLSS